MGLRHETGTTTRTRGGHRRWVAVGVAIIAALSSCGTGTYDADEGLEEIELPARLQVGDRGDLDGPTIVLSTELTDGATWTGSMVQDLQIEVDGDSSGSAPVTSMGMAVEVDEIVPGEEWRLIVTYGPVEIIDGRDFSTAQLAAIESVLSTMDGVAVETSVDQFGVFDEATLLNADRLDPAIRAQMETMMEQTSNLGAIVTPYRVGVGATWTDTMSITLQGVVTDSITTYRLVAVDGDQYTLAVEQEQEQRAEEGSSTGVDISTSNLLVGEVVGVIGEPLPLRSTMSGSGSGTITVDGVAYPMTMEIDMTIEGS